MADIDIQKKEGGGNIWPWILGLIVVVGLIWVVVEAVDTDEGAIVEDVDPGVMPGEETPPLGGTEAMPPETGMDGDVPAAVDEFVSYVDEEGDTTTVAGQGEMDRSHEYTATALMHLSNALNAVVESEGNGDMQLEATRDTLERRAEMIQQDPESSRHAESVHEAVTAAADLMDQLQMKQFPDLQQEVSEVREAAQAITPSGDLLAQRDAVHRFFTEAGEALERMAAQSNGLALN